MRFLVFLLCLFLSSQVYAQYGYNYRYLNSYPRYYVPYYYVPYRYHYYYYQNPNPPRRLSANEIRERWVIQDEYKERNKTENALDRKERMLDQSERAYELSKREDDLRYRGILPPKKPSGIVFNGVQYSSYEELSNSQAYQDMLLDRAIERREKEFQKQFEKERSDAFLQMWHKLDDIGRQQFSRLSPEEKEIRIDAYHDFDR